MGDKYTDRRINEKYIDNNYMKYVYNIFPDNISKRIKDYMSEIGILDQIHPNDIIRKILRSQIEREQNKQNYEKVRTAYHIIYSGNNDIIIQSELKDIPKLGPLLNKYIASKNNWYDNENKAYDAYKELISRQARSKYQSQAKAANKSKMKRVQKRMEESKLKEEEEKKTVRFEVNYDGSEDYFDRLLRQVYSNENREYSIVDVDVSIPQEILENEILFSRFIDNIKEKCARASHLTINDKNIVLMYEFSVMSELGTRTYTRETFLASYLRLKDKTNTTKSDDIVYDNIKHNNNFTITFFRRKGQSNRGGRYWKYFNTTEMDFEKLGIFREIPNDFVDSCFLESLRALGYNNEIKMGQLCEYINRGRITNKNMPKAAKVLGIQIKLWSELNINDRDKSDKRKAKGQWKKWKSYNWNTECEDIYELVETEDHYMPMLTFDISKHYLENYLSWRGIYSPNHYKKYTKSKRHVITKAEDLTRCITYTRKKGKLEESIVDYRATTKDIVWFLLNTPGVQKPIGANDIDSMCSYFNEDMHFEELCDMKEEYSKPVDKQATKDYYSRIAYIKNKSIYNKNYTDEKVEMELKSFEKYVHKDKYDNKFVYPTNLPDKYKDLYHPDNKFNTSDQLRKEFFPLIESQEFFRKIKTEDGYWREVVDFNHKNDVTTKQYRNIYLDLESGFQPIIEENSKGEKQTKYRHIPYCICYVDDNNKEYKFKGPTCIKDCLDSLKGRYRVYCHNMKYEMQFIFKYLTNIQDRNNLKIIQSGGSIYNVSGYYINKETKFASELFFKDSYKLISSPLSKFDKIFGLKIAKDICPYDLYTIDNIYKEEEKISSALKYIKNKDKDQFMKNIEKYRTGPDTFKHIEYSIDYCMQDCRVTKAGVEKFREWLYILTLQDVHNVLTSASIANNYLTEAGCYEGCYKISNIPRHFIQKCVIGGRVMCRDNKRQHIKEAKIQDFDAVSLYPSAMYRIGNNIGGYIKGKPKLLLQEQLNKAFLDTVDAYFIEIQVNKCNKHLHMPIGSYKDDTNIRRFENLINKTIYVDKYGFEDLIRYQDIKYKITKGYYYNEGRNNKIKETIRNVFDERLKFKKLNNPIQMVYKLIMNSSYGKTIQKAHDTKVQIVREDQITEYKIKNWHLIKYIDKVRESNLNIVTLYDSINKHYSMPHIGTEILSMSKRIMNEVMCLAESMKIPIWYTDTDSMHINDSDIPLLEKEFNNKYKRKLIGKSLGQFHSDFSSSKGKVLYSTELIAITKKMYIDKLLIEDGSYDYHIRMKGISTSSILHNNKDPMKTYSIIYKGEPVEFDLCADRVIFEFDKGFGVKKIDHFIRKIHVPK